MSTDSKADRIRHYLLYQLRVRSELPLHGIEVEAGEYELEILVRVPEDARPFQLTEANRIFTSAISGAMLYRDGASICLQYPGIVDFFLLNDRQVISYPAADASQSLVTSLLEGPLFALLLERRGIICLHASAVEINGQAVAFLGKSGAGKSTIAAHFVDQGYPLITDDILPLTTNSHACFAIPSYPQIKTRPDFIVPSGRHASLDVPLNKHLHSVGYDWGKFTTQRSPLQIAYILQPEEDLSQPVEIEQLSCTDYFLETIRLSFCAGAIGPLGLAAKRFHQVGLIANFSEVRRLRYQLTNQDWLGVCVFVLSDRLNRRLP